MSLELLDLTGMSLEEMEEFFKKLGEPRFRGQQTIEWIHAKGASSFDEMTNLSKALRTKLNQIAHISPLTLVRRQISTIDKTTKYLFRLEDGNTIESVLMLHDYGTSACLSTQVGCKMGCGFCATAMSGFSRNLTTGEIVSQALYISRDLKEEGKRLGNVVLMGMGEPLDNYQNSLRAVRLLNLDQGLNIGYRHITISTCGLIPGINLLAQEGLPITLAISLHASNDRTRNKIMPINRKYPIKGLIGACKAYVEATRRRVTFEYILIKGLNDSKKEAQELSALLKGILCHVNLIPMNPVEGSMYKPVEPDITARFLSELENAGISATVRREMGADIDGACGQLRRRTLEVRKSFI